MLKTRQAPALPPFALRGTPLATLRGATTTWRVEACRTSNVFVLFSLATAALLLASTIPNSEWRSSEVLRMILFSAFRALPWSCPKIKPNDCSRHQ